MATFRGSCHCGRVRFEVEAHPSHRTECNCTLCRGKGALYLPVSETESVRALAGDEYLTEYQFHTRTARHYFCRVCGIHTFHRPRISPERWGVNARCLDGFDLTSLRVVPFDGQNWERSARREGWPG